MGAVRSDDGAAGCVSAQQLQICEVVKVQPFICNPFQLKLPAEVGRDCLTALMGEGKEEGSPLQHAGNPVWPVITHRVPGTSGRLRVADWA